MFNLRNGMLKLKEKIIENQMLYCICKEEMNNEHLYICQYLNATSPKYEYSAIYKENNEKLQYITERIKYNMKKFLQNDE